MMSDLAPTIRDADDHLQTEMSLARAAIADLVNRYYYQIDLSPDEKVFLAHLKGAQDKLQRATVVLRDVLDGGGVYFDTPEDRRAYNLKQSMR